MKMTKEERDAARARCEAAAPGPWDRRGNHIVDGKDSFLGVLTGHLPFITHARTDLPRALGTIDALEDEIEIHQINREKVLAALRGGCTIEQLKQIMHLEPLDEARILPGSDIGQGRLNLAHWHAKLLAGSMLDILHLNDAQNYVEMTISDGEQAVLVTVQRSRGESPATKADRLEKELKAMTLDRDKFHQAVVDCLHATGLEDAAWCKEDVEAITNEALTDDKDHP